MITLFIITLKLIKGFLAESSVLPCEEKSPRSVPLPKAFLEDLYQKIVTIEGLSLTNKQEFNSENEEMEPIRLPPGLHAKRLKPMSRQLLESGVHFLEEYTMMELSKPKRRISTDHVPVFFHLMLDKESKPAFFSGDIEEFTGVFEYTFAVAGDYEYFCQHHPIMTGIVRVILGGPANVSVNMTDGPPMAFSPNDVTVGTGGEVRWENHSMFHHTVTSKEGVGFHALYQWKRFCRKLTYNSGSFRSAGSVGMYSA